MSSFLLISTILLQILKIYTLETVYLNGNNNNLNPIGSYNDPFQNLEQLFLLNSNEQVEVVFQSDILCNSSLTNKMNISFEYLIF